MNGRLDAIRVRRMRVSAGIAAFALLFGAFSTLAQEQGAYYIDLGKQALRGKRYMEAVQDFRIARFMTLDDPTLQTQALALLALSQESAGLKADSATTLDRFLEVEDSFGAFRLDALDPDLQARFKSVLLARYPRERILKSQSLSAELGLIPRSQVTPRRTPPPGTPTLPVATAVPTRGVVA